jgi:YesN/AraC family two-component response regulator
LQRQGCAICYFSVPPVSERAGKITAQHCAGAFVALILQQVSLSSGYEDKMDEAGASMAWKAKQLIRTQFHLPLSTSQLARALHCNADYLGRVFRRTFHLTLTEAIHRQRVRAAEKLLLNDSASLTEVATRCGFNDVGYFRQIFTKHTG